MPDSQPDRVLSPSGRFDPEIARWLAALEECRQRTLQVLEDPAFDPAATGPGSNTPGSLLYHVVVIEMSYVYEDILGVGWSPELEPLLPYSVRDEADRLVAVEDSMSVHLDRLTASRQLTMRAFEGMTIDTFRMARHTSEYSISPEWTVHHLMQHEAEHRAQLSAFRNGSS